jgi:hypothetical protein
MPPEGGQLTPPLAADGAAHRGASGLSRGRLPQLSQLLRGHVKRHSAGPALAHGPHTPCPSMRPLPPLPLPSPPPLPAPCRPAPCAGRAPPSRSPGPPAEPPARRSEARQARPVQLAARTMPLQARCEAAAVALHAQLRARRASRAAAAHRHASAPPRTSLPATTPSGTPKASAMSAARVKNSSTCNEAAAWGWVSGAGGQGPAALLPTCAPNPIPHRPTFVARKTAVMARRPGSSSMEERRTNSRLWNTSAVACRARSHTPQATKRTSGTRAAPAVPLCGCYERPRRLLTETLLGMRMPRHFSCAQAGPHSSACKAQQKDLDASVPVPCCAEIVMQRRGTRGLIRGVTAGAVPRWRRTRMSSWLYLSTSASPSGDTGSGSGARRGHGSRARQARTVKRTSPPTPTRPKAPPSAAQAHRIDIKHACIPLTSRALGRAALRALVGLAGRALLPPDKVEHPRSRLSPLLRLRATCCCLHCCRCKGQRGADGCRLPPAAQG